MGQLREDGTWHDTCLDKLKKGEPFFVLRAQDITASRLVRLWAEMANDKVCPRIKINEAYDTAAAMEDWEPRKYPD